MWQPHPDCRYRDGDGFYMAEYNIILINEYTNCTDFLSAVIDPYLDGVCLGRAAGVFFEM